MPTVLGELQERLEAAKIRLTTAQQRHQASQVELNAAAAEHNIWNAAVQIEMREEAARAAAAQVNQIPIPLPSPELQTSVQEDNPEAEAESHAEPVNKTDLVREQLRAHPMGMTASELWNALREPVSNRAYLYSILKRLRDKEEIVFKRGKYVLKAAPVEMKKENESMLVQ